MLPHHRHPLPDNRCYLDAIKEMTKLINLIDLVIIKLIKVVMFPNTRFRRSLVLIGGSGELGKVVTARFTKPLLFRWNVFNIDSVPNPDATTNFIIDTSL
jgi:hypothetical protein